MSVQQDTNSNSLHTPANDFRESLGTMESTGKRKWIFPRKPKGKFTNYRTYVSWFLLITLISLPFVKINGNPLFKLNIVAREFYFFGNYFPVQDFYIVAIGGITFLVFIILFTVVFGRLFCGWICPQTIFMEMVFRKIEFAIEGDRNAQMRLSRQTWNAEKIRKKGLKWFVFFILSFLIAHTFLSYIIGVEPLFRMVKEGVSLHWDTFSGLLIFTALFFFVYAWFREQACTLVCPYGRLQGVLIDRKTIVVAYDFKRGESTAGRASWKKNEDRNAAGKGDCIDCGNCVVVCPTGIDIRNGSNQLECVSCTACIDACDEVMEKINLPKGLIKYSSLENIETNTPWKFNARVIAYTLVLAVLLVIFGISVFYRPSVKAEVLRLPGMNYIEKGDAIYNQYQFDFINKTNDDKTVSIKITSPKEASLELNGLKNSFKIKAKGEYRCPILIKIPKTKLQHSKRKISISIYDENGVLLDTENSNFLAPSHTIY